VIAVRRSEIFANDRQHRRIGKLEKNDRRGEQNKLPVFWQGREWRGGNGRPIVPASRSVSAAAYSDAKLRKKDLSLGGVLILRKLFAFRLDKSVRYQTIKREFLVRSQILGPFCTPSAHDITEDSQFLVVDRDGLTHANGLLQSPRPLNFTLLV